MLVLQLEGVGAVARWKSLLGHSAPATWASNPLCLRAQFSNEAKQNPLYGSPSPLTVAKELEFFFASRSYACGSR